MFSKVKDGERRNDVLRDVLQQAGYVHRGASDAQLHNGFAARSCEAIELRSEDATSASVAHTKNDKRGKSSARIYAADEPTRHS